MAWVAPDFRRVSTTMKALAICAGLAAFAISLGSVDAALAANAGNAHILVVDRNALISTSKLGQNIRAQLMGYTQKLQSDLGPESQAIESESQALDSSKLPADARAKESKALQAKQAAFQQKVRDRQSLIQGGQIAARKYFMAQVDSAVHAIMTERGADTVLDKSTVVASANGADITKDVVAALDKKSASFKVPLVKPSLEDQLQMQAMRQGGAGGQ